MKKAIKFRPLRKVKLTGKVVVASYMQWRKIKTTDRNDGLVLVVDPEYQDLSDDLRVYNHKGVELFWENYDPEKIPYVESLGHLGEKKYNRNWKTEYGTYSAKGLDVEGVPLFSHLYPDAIYNSKMVMTNLQPLTVKEVKWWFGWFLYQLENTTIEYVNY